MSALVRHTSTGTCLAAVCVLASGCGAPAPSLEDLNASYEQALARTAPMAAVLEPGSAAERDAFARIQDYFSQTTVDSVRAKTTGVYAPGAYLNDTLVGIDGVAAIEDYFARTMERATLLDVEFLDRAPAGNDWYVRWRMTVEADGLKRGQPVVTYGVTQFRFDEQGRVLIHKDFWDSGSGLYEQLPVIGSLINRVRAAVEDDQR